MSDWTNHHKEGKPIPPEEIAHIGAQLLEVNYFM